MLLGRAPRLADSAPTLAVDPENNVFRVTLRAEGQSQELWVDPGRKRVVRSTVDGPSGYTLTFDGFEDVHGVADLPQYTNVQMPFPNLPPAVPDDNPTGVYRRRFRLPIDWQGRRVILHFGGCEGALYVYVNGQPVGLSKDARTPAEFDISALYAAEASQAPGTQSPPSSVPASA